jgi:hypothetical protein
VKRVLAALTVVVIVASALTGVLIWKLSRDHGPSFPEISAYTKGQLARVGPYQYCNVQLTECENPREEGELVVDRDHPVQLSVPEAISRTLWFMTLKYEGSEVVQSFRAHTKLAVTVPTYDAQRGRLFGIAVFVPTFVRIDGEEVPAPHAEWSVRTVWP